MDPPPACQCPEPARGAFLELLTWTLITIRNNPEDSRLCQELADHMHNVPALLGAFDAEKLRYYWEVERPCFLRAMLAMGQATPSMFDEPWEAIEDLYLRL